MGTFKGETLYLNSGILFPKMNLIVKFKFTFALNGNFYLCRKSWKNFCVGVQNFHKFGFNLDGFSFTDFHCEAPK